LSSFFSSFFHIFTLNWYSQLFQISVFSATFRVFATLLRKSRKAVNPIAVGNVKLTDQTWHISCSLYKTLMSKTFPQESSEAFFNLKKSALSKTKKTSPARFNRVLWKALRKNTCFFRKNKKKHFEKIQKIHLVFQKRNFLALPHLFWISLWVSLQNSWKNSSKVVFCKVLPASRCRDYALRFHWCMYIFYWIQYKFWTG